MSAKDSKLELVPGTENLLHDFFSEFLDTCIQRELGIPFFIVAVAANGVVIVQRANAGPNLELLIEDWCERLEHEMMAVPVMVGAIDPVSGKALLGRIDAEGVKEYLN